MSTAFLLIFVAAPLAFVLFVAGLAKLHFLKLRRAARQFPCVRCQALLGDAAVSIADDLWRKHVQTLRERQPDVKLRLTRDLHAVCTQCGARYKFDWDRTAFDESESVLCFEAASSK